MSQSPDKSGGAFGTASPLSESNSSGAVLPENRAESAPNERLRTVIRAFHAEVGSPLAAVAIRLELLRNRESLDPATSALIEELSRSIGEVIESVRRSLKDLRDLEYTSRWQP